MKKANRLIVLSPHFDDAIFSVGGLISLFSIYFNEIYIVNIFSASPPLGKELPPQAADFHKNFIQQDPVAYRRILDIKAFKAYRVKLFYIEQLDAIYRTFADSKEPLYLEPIDIFTAIHSFDYQLISKISSKILSMISPDPSDLYIAPLSIGGHVDHEITRLAGERIAKNQLLYYEDCPYVFQQTIRNSLKFCQQTMDMIEIYIPVEDLLKKQFAINAYNSSIPTKSFIQYMQSHDKIQRSMERIYYNGDYLSNTSRQILSSIPGKLSFNKDIR